MIEIFVFGSNLAGIHGAGSALEARNSFGAILGQGIGLQGHSYAIPTKDENLKTLPLEKIAEEVDKFKNFAYTMRESMEFRVVKIGCGLAGYREDQIGPLFKGSGENVILPKGWEKYR